MSTKVTGGLTFMRTRIFGSLRLGR